MNRIRVTGSLLYLKKSVSNIELNAGYFRLLTVEKDTEGEYSKVNPIYLYEYMKCWRFGQLGRL